MTRNKQLRAILTLTSVNATLLLTSSGCSLAFVDGPPQVRPMGATVPATATCTTSRLIPMGDGLLALAGGMSATWLFTEVWFPYLLLAPHLLVAACATPILLATSSVVGWKRVTRCREFLLTPVNGDEATAAYETYLRWRPPMLRDPRLSLGSIGGRAAASRDPEARTIPGAPSSPSTGKGDSK